MVKNMKEPIQTKFNSLCNYYFYKAQGQLNPWSDCYSYTLIIIIIIYSLTSYYW
jgi:hypothetical protein